MKTKYDNIFSKSECVSIDMKQKYLENKLDSKEMFLVEKHLLDCEMCSDEMEGLSYLKNINQLKDINEKIVLPGIFNNNYEKPKTIRLNSWKKVISIAAMVVVISGIFVIVNNLVEKNQSEYMAVETESEIDSSQNIHFEDLYEMTVVEEKIEKEFKGIEKQELNKQEIEKPEIEDYKELQIVENVEVVENQLSVMDEDITEEESDYENEIYEISEEENENLKKPKSNQSFEKSSQKSISANVPEARRFKAVQPASESVEETKSPKNHFQISNISEKKRSKSHIKEQTNEKSDLDKAMNKYNAGKYKSALKILSKEISKQEDNFKLYIFQHFATLKLKNMMKL